MHRFVFAFVLLLTACATTPADPIAADVAGLRSGAIDPASYDWGALRWGRGPEGAAAFDALSREVAAQHRTLADRREAENAQPAAQRASACTAGFLRNLSLGVWINLVAVEPDQDAFERDAALVRARFATLRSVSTAPNADALDVRLDHTAFRHQIALMHTANDPRVRELMRRYLLDQSFRRALNGIDWNDGISAVGAAEWPHMAPIPQIDCSNTAWMRSQLAEIGWFDMRTYGGVADESAWTLVQHADMTPAFQAETLTTLARLEPLGGTNARNFAYLWDRVARAENRPQRYGTQGGCDNGAWAPRPSEDPDHLDERRASVGLGPEADYIASFVRNFPNACHPIS